MRLSIKWEAWNRLPHDVQRVIDELGPAGGECWFASKCGLDLDTQSAAALEYVKLHGELIILTQSELDRWIKLMQPTLNTELDTAEAKGMPGRKFYARILELVQKCSNQS